MTLRMALGAMHLGTKIGYADSCGILDAYVEAGGVWIDTANCYAFWASASGYGGQSETLLGDWIASRNAHEHVRLSTKVGAEPCTPGGFPQDVEGLGQRVVQAAVHQSLNRLRVEKIDLFWAHMEDRSQSISQVTSTFGELVTRGLVSEIGLSNHPAWYAAIANTYAKQSSTPEFTALQLRESYLHPRPDIPVEGEDHPNGMMTAESRDYAARAGISLWAYTPLLNGLYEHPERPLPAAYEHPGSHIRLARIHRWASGLGIKPSQVVLAWLTNTLPQIMPVVGCSTPAQVREAIEATSMTLPTEVLNDLNALDQA